MKKLAPFDKYFYYKESVQSPEEDAQFFKKIYKYFNKKDPKTLREDFCGSFSVSVAWLKLGKDFRVIGVDKDPIPLNYGKKHHLSELNSSEKKRIQVIKNSVLSPSLPKADIISVLNFSYFIFKERQMLLRYFKNVYNQLNKEGIFIIDIFGGSHLHSPREDKVSYKDFTYYWEQENFNPINQEAFFSIHFKRKGEKKRKRVFTYDWRIWSISELKDILQEAGFAQTHVYWETFDKKGEATNLFRKRKVAESCDSWLAYLVAIP